jgi:hypothetical protein
MSPQLLGFYLSIRYVFRIWEEQHDITAQGNAKDSGHFPVHKVRTLKPTIYLLISQLFSRILLLNRAMLQLFKIPIEVLLIRDCAAIAVLKDLSSRIQIIAFLATPMVANISIRAFLFYAEEKPVMTIWMDGGDSAALALVISVS